MFGSSNLFGSTTQPPIDAERNAAKPCESILEDALATVAGEPPIVAGVKIELADTEPSIVTPSVIVPPSNKKLLPVTSPFCLTLKFDVLINIYSSLSIPPCFGEPLMNICSLLNECESVVNPPIKPEDAVILPSNVAPLAIKIPSLLTIKFGPILI